MLIIKRHVGLRCVTPVRFMQCFSRTSVLRRDLLTHLLFPMEQNSAPILEPFSPPTSSEISLLEKEQHIDKTRIIQSIPNLSHSSLEVSSRRHAFLNPSNRAMKRNETALRGVLSLQDCIREAAVTFVLMGRHTEEELFTNGTFTREILEQAFVRLYYAIEPGVYASRVHYDYEELPDPLQSKIENLLRVFLCASAYSFHLAFEHFFANGIYAHSDHALRSKCVALELFMLWWYVNPDLLLMDLSSSMRFLPRSPHCDTEATSTYGPNLNNLLGLHLLRDGTQGGRILTSSVTIPKEYREHLTGYFSFIAQRRFHVKCALLSRVVQVASLCSFQCSTLRPRCLEILSELFQFCNQVMPMDDDDVASRRRWVVYFSTIVATTTLYDFRKQIISIRNDRLFSSRSALYHDYIQQARERFLQLLADVFAADINSDDPPLLVFAAVVKCFEEGFYTPDAVSANALYQQFAGVIGLARVWKKLFRQLPNTFPDVFHASSIFSVLWVFYVQENIAGLYPKNMTYAKELCLQVQRAPPTGRVERWEDSEWTQCYRQSVTLQTLSALDRAVEEVVQAYCALGHPNHSSLFVLVRLARIRAAVGESLYSQKGSLAASLEGTILPNCDFFVKAFLNKLLVQSLAHGDPNSIERLFSEFSGNLESLPISRAWTTIVEALLYSGLPATTDLTSLGRSTEKDGKGTHSFYTVFGVGSLSFKTIYLNATPILNSSSRGENEVNRVEIFQHLLLLANTLPHGEDYRFASLSSVPEIHDNGESLEHREELDIKQTNENEKEIEEDDVRNSEMNAYDPNEENDDDDDDDGVSVTSGYTSYLRTDEDPDMEEGQGEPTRVLRHLQEEPTSGASVAETPTTDVSSLYEIENVLQWYTPKTQRLFLSLLAVVAWCEPKWVSDDLEKSVVGKSTVVNGSEKLEPREVVLLLRYYHHLRRQLHQAHTDVPLVLSHPLSRRLLLLTVCKTVPDLLLVATLVLLSLRFSTVGFLTLQEENALARVLVLNGVKVSEILCWRRGKKLSVHGVEGVPVMLGNYGVLLDHLEPNPTKEVSLLIGSLLLHSLEMRYHSSRRGTRLKGWPEFNQRKMVEGFLSQWHQRNYYTQQFLLEGPLPSSEPSDKKASKEKGPISRKVIFPSLQMHTSSAGDYLSNDKKLPEEIKRIVVQEGHTASKDVTDLFWNREEAMEGFFHHPKLN